jgi:hypothetical protein
MLRYMYIACIIFISYHEATLYVSIHSFGKPVNKYFYSSSRLFVSTWHYLCVRNVKRGEVLTEILLTVEVFRVVMTSTGN